MKQNRSIFRNVSRLQDRYDWSRARFEQAGSREVTEGAYKGYTELSINVEVPAFSGRSLKMRFLAYLQRVTSETAASIRTLVQQAFRTSTSESVETAPNLNKILSRVKTDIKTHHPGAKVEMKFQEEVLDIIFSDFLPQDRNRMEMPHGYASP